MDRAHVTSAEALVLSAALKMYESGLELEAEFVRRQVDKDDVGWRLFLTRQLLSELAPR